jgi:hypothetical protein
LALPRADFSGALDRFLKLREGETDIVFIGNATHHPTTGKRATELENAVSSCVKFYNSMNGVIARSLPGSLLPAGSAWENRVKRNAGRGMK